MISVRVIPALITSAILGLGSLLTAQSNAIELRGQVEISLQGGCYYCPPITRYVIHGSETPIRSNTIDLSAFVGLYVKVDGTWSMVGAQPVIDVTSVLAVAPALNIAGNARIGNTLRWSTAGAPGELAVQVLSFGASFVPVVGTAVLLLDPSSILIVGAGSIDPSGSFRTDLPIPNSTLLIGRHIFGQSLIAPGGSAPFYFSNPETKRIQ